MLSFCYAIELIALACMIKGQIADCVAFVGNFKMTLAAMKITDY